MPYFPRKRTNGEHRGIRVPLRRVPGEGPMPADIMFIGERPGKQEAQRGRPFVGPAGVLFNLCLESAGIERESVYVTNLVKTYAEYDKPTREEIDEGAEELREEIECVQPKVIGTLGTYATEWLLDRDRAGLEKSHGVPIRLGARGEAGSGILVVPCYHPAAGLYSADSLALTMADIYSVQQVAQGHLRPLEDGFPEPEYRETGYFETYDECGAIDTEGSERHPWCLTYSNEPGTALLVRPPIAPRFDGRIFLHNSLHDLGVLRGLGVELGEDQFRDTMLWAYLLQLEPQGLKPLAFRHCGMEMMSYDEVIGPASYDKAMEYLLEADTYEWPKAEPYVIIKSGVATVKKPNSVNQRIRRIINDCRKAGSDTDPRARWGKVDEWLQRPIVEVMGPMPAATLDDVPYEVARDYACRDSDATLRLAPILQAKISSMGLDRVSEIDHAILPMIDRMHTVGIKLAPKEFWDQLEVRCDEQMGRAKLGIFNATGASINPDSGDQVAELLFDQLGISPPKLTKSGERGSTNDKALETIRERRDVVDLVGDYREASKVKSSFVSPLRKRTQVDDARARCTFRTTRVVTGRLAATNPNLLAIPIRSELGKRVRDGFIAGEGKVLGDWDLNQIEMRFMAHESQDDVLCGLFNQGTVDVHSATASHMFSVPIGNVRVEQRYAAKRVGFGVITGITGHGLVDQMNLARARRPDGEPWTEDDCDQMIELWFDQYRGVKRYMLECGDYTRQHGFIRDWVGRMRYLPGIWSPFEWVQDEARRQAHSFRIQAGAQAIMKIAMKQIWDCVCKLGLAEPLLQVHDEILLEVEDDKQTRETVDEMVVECLTKSTELRVPVKAGGGYGHTWAEAH